MVQQVQKKISSLAPLDSPSTTSLPTTSLSATTKIRRATYRKITAKEETTSSEMPVSQDQIKPLVPKAGTEDDALIPEYKGTRRPIRPLFGNEYLFYHIANSIREPITCQLPTTRSRRFQPLRVYLYWYYQPSKRPSYLVGIDLATRHIYCRSCYFLCTAHHKGFSWMALSSYSCL